MIPSVTVGEQSLHPNLMKNIAVQNYDLRLYDENESYSLYKITIEIPTFQLHNIYLIIYISFYLHILG